MTPNQILARVATSTALLIGGVGAADTSLLNEVPIDRIDNIAGEVVKVKQSKNTVEAEFPWKGEKGIKVKYDMGEPTASEKLRDKRDKQVVTELVDFGDGGFKVDILLDKKPDSNIFCYTIEGAENYDFFYQPPLTPEEIADGEERPAEIEGSYAVYHKQLKNHRSGSANYATGKVMHIPRPQVWEVDNKASTTVWADLDYNNGQLCVTVDENYLQKAKYPVRVDPTFGYTSVGGSNTSFTDDFYGSIWTTPSDFGTLRAGFAYVSRASGNPSYKLVIVETSGLTIVGNGVHTETRTSFWPSNSFGTFTEATTTAPADMVANTDYVLGVVSDAGGAGPILYYDTTGTTDQGKVDLSNSYSTPTDPTDATDNDNVYSIYASYCLSTDSCGPFTTTFLTSENWTAPTGVDEAIVSCWGAGGGGFDGGTISQSAGGGGGAFASSTVSVTAGVSYPIVIGAGGTENTDGGDSTFATTTVVAAGGSAGQENATGAGGTVAASTGDVKYAGGLGNLGANEGTQDLGGGGGGAAGPHGAGNDGTVAVSGVGGAGGSGDNGFGGSGGSGGNPSNGGDGGSNANGGGGGGGGDNGNAGGNGGFPGGGGGGGEICDDGVECQGADGQCTITYTITASEGGSSSPIPDIVWF